MGFAIKIEDSIIRSLWLCVKDPEYILFWLLILKVFGLKLRQNYLKKSQKLPKKYISKKQIPFTSQQHKENLKLMLKMQGKTQNIIWRKRRILRSYIKFAILFENKQAKIYYEFPFNQNPETIQFNFQLNQKQRDQKQKQKQQKQHPSCKGKIYQYWIKFYLKFPKQPPNLSMCYIVCLNRDFHIFYFIDNRLYSNTALPKSAISKSCFIEILPYRNLNILSLIISWPYHNLLQKIKTQNIKMRRSSKAGQLVNNSGNDDTYKFRCMEYLNFVLDQIVNSNNKFKIYPSHIENILRNSLNDITIQDIEKIKRMLDQGEKMKTQTQQTGEFINYDLLQKKNYSLNSTRYYLEEGPQQAMMYFYDHNQYTLQEIQLQKNKRKQQRLQQHNYSMLDMMFKLPQDQKKVQMLLQKQYQKQDSKFQVQKEEFKFEKLITEQQNTQKFLSKQSESIHKSQEKKNNNTQTEKTQKIPQILSIGKNNNKTIQKQLEKSKQLVKSKSIEKQKQDIAGGCLDVSFVQIKGKKKQRKKPVKPSPSKLQIQKVEKVDIKQVLSAEKAETNKLLKQNEIQIQNNQVIKQVLQADQNKLDNEPLQKRKYIRKKPLQPRKNKVGRQKQQNSLQKIADSQAIDVLVVQNPVQLQKQDDLKVQQKPIDQSPIDQSQERKPQIKVQVYKSEDSSAIKQQLPAIRPQQEQMSEQKVKKIKRQRKHQKVQKVGEQIKIQPQRSLQKVGEQIKIQPQRSQSKALQIVLPYPDCEQEGDRIKKQIQQIKKLQFQISLFEQNPSNLFEMIKTKNNTTQNKADPEQVEVSIFKDLQYQNQKITSRIQNKTQIQKKRTKKNPIKSALTKKQTKKQSSQSYKPAEDELESVSESLQPNGESLLQQNAPEPKEKKARKRPRKIKTQPLKELSKQNSRLMPQNEPTQKRQNQSNAEGSSQKEKRKKFTIEQRQRLKQEKQRLKQIRNKQKQERAKLKQQQRLIKQAKKNKKLQKSQTHSKQKKGQKEGANSISINECSSFALAASIEDKSQILPAKKIQIIDRKRSPKKKKAILHENNQLFGQIQKKQVPKKGLQDSIGNSSTREDIKNYSLSLDKQHNLSKLQAIAEYQKEAQKDGGQYLQFIFIQTPKDKNQSKHEQSPKSHVISKFSPKRERQELQGSLEYENLEGLYPRKQIKPNIEQGRAQGLEQGPGQSAQYGENALEQNVQDEKMKIFELDFDLQDFPVNQQKQRFQEPQNYQ